MDVFLIQSALEQRVINKNTSTADGNAWVKEDTKKKEEDDKDDAASESGDTSKKSGHSLKAAVQAVTAAVDLLDMSEPEPAPPAPSATEMEFAPVAAPTPPPAPVAAAVTGGTVIGVSAETLPSMRTWFNELVLTPQGILFEDAHVQVTFRHAYQQHQARLAIYIKNKTGAPFSNAKADIPQISYLKVTTTQPLAAAVQPGETGSMVVCIYFIPSIINI